MKQTIILGLAGMLGIVLFSCVLSFYQGVKKSIKIRIEKLKEEKIKHNLWKQEVKTKRIYAQLLADDRRGMYEELSNFIGS